MRLGLLFLGFALGFALGGGLGAVLDRLGLGLRADQRRIGLVAGGQGNVLLPVDLK